MEKASALESVHVANDMTKKIAVENQTVRRPAPITTDILWLGDSVAPSPFSLAHDLQDGPRDDIK